MSSDPLTGMVHGGAAEAKEHRLDDPVTRQELLDAIEKVGRRWNGNGNERDLIGDALRMLWDELR